MSALNFLRYLLIRDRRELNQVSGWGLAMWPHSSVCLFVCLFPCSLQTGVWSILDGLSAEFLRPLRQLLAETGMQCRGELQVKQEEAKMPSQGGRRKATSGDPAVTVEIADQGSLPEPSLEDEIEVFPYPYME